MTRSTIPQDHDLIGCAQSAWRLSGKYPLERWTVKETGWNTWVVAYGTPPRAKHEYHHVFLYNGRWNAGHYQYVLVGIAKAPWHKSVKFQGARFTAGQVVANYPTGRAALPKNVLDHERIKGQQDMHQTCCTHCHTCGAELKHLDPDLLWCEACQTYR
jgi:hypothetical protein